MGGHEGTQRETSNPGLRIMMKTLLLAFCVMFAFGDLSGQTTIWQPSPGHAQTPIWPGAAPDAQPVAAAEIATTRLKDNFVGGEAMDLHRERLDSHNDSLFADRKEY